MQLDRRHRHEAPTSGGGGERGPDHDYDDDRGDDVPTRCAFGHALQEVIEVLRTLQALRMEYISPRKEEDRKIPRGAEGRKLTSTGR